MTEKFVCKRLSFFDNWLSCRSFAFFAAVMLTTGMMKTLSNEAIMGPDAASRLAGARILVMERCFQALVEQMIADGSDPANAAAVLLEHLVERMAGRVGS